MKKGEPPSMEGSSWRPGGCRNRSTSWPRANCGMRVSSLVLTITVRASVGSVCAKDASVDLPFISVCLQRTDQNGQPGARHITLRALLHSSAGTPDGSSKAPQVRRVSEVHYEVQCTGCAIRAAGGAALQVQACNPRNIQCNRLGAAPA